MFKSKGFMKIDILTLTLFSYKVCHPLSLFPLFV